MSKELKSMQKDILDLETEKRGKDRQLKTNVDTNDDLEMR